MAEWKVPAVKVAVIYYSMFGHIQTMAEAVAKGARSTGASVKILQIQETLPQEVLTKMHAAPKANYPIATPNDLAEADAILFGVPTRYGSAAAQVKTLFDATGQLWLQGKLVGKLASVFFSSGSQNGGQETTAFTFYTNFVHHGMIIVPIGYTCPALMNLQEVHGGSPYGAGTLSGDGSRRPSPLELGIAEHQGRHVSKYAIAFKRGLPPSAPSEPEVELLYFDMKGRGDIIRYILVETKTPFTDTRVSMTEWPKLKPTLPFNQLPILKVSGKMIPQSQAIIRYLAREKKLMGATLEESAQIDAISESAKDVFEKYMSAVYASEGKEQKINEFYAWLVTYLKSWTKILEQNGKRFFVGKGLTYCDLAIFDALNQCYEEDTLKDYPLLQEFVASIKSRPGISEYIAARATV